MTSLDLPVLLSIHHLTFDWNEIRTYPEAYTSKSDFRHVETVFMKFYAYSQVENVPV